jgi:DNA-binding winged helix-turn-helix (wHTH) protein/tetratricopeptide (TPR) repeat protein
MPKQFRNLYECGPFVLDPENRTLVREGKPVPIPPKAFETLLLLIEHRGNLLEKEQLLRMVWPDTFVEENNLTQYISLLRKVLGDDVGEQQYIETVPKLGYRFVAPVRAVTREAGLLVTRHTRARIVVREEEEEIDNSEENEKVREGVVRVLPRSRAASVSHVLKLGFGLLTLFVIALAVYWHLSKTEVHTAVPKPVVNARRSVAILGFKNLSGNSDADWLSTALAEMLATELAAGGQLRTASGEEIARMKADLTLVDSDTLSRTTLAQVRKNLGVDVIIAGSYIELGRDSGRQIRLDLRLQDTAAGETIGSITEVGTVVDLFQLVSSTGAQLRTKLGAPEVSGAEESEFHAALPSSPEAARLYSQGLSKLRAFDAPAGQKLLSKAVAVDPQYALGHSALAEAWSALGYDEKAKAEAKRALDLADNLSRQDHLLIGGRYWEMTRQWDKAVETYLLLLSFFPDNLEYGLRLASAQTSAGKGRDALATVTTLRKLPPPLGADPQIDLAEAAADESLGEFKQERQTSEVAAQKGEALGERLLVARARAKEGWALSRLGDTQHAIAVLQEATKLFAAAGDGQGVASTLNAKAVVLENEGDYSASKQSNKEALQSFARVGDRRGMARALNSMAVAHYEQGELEKAKALFEQSLQIQREVGSKTNVAGVLGNIADVLDAEGKLAEAQKLTEESVKVFTEVGDQRALGTALGILASLLYEQGDLSSAKKTYEDALKIKREIGYQRGIAYDLSGLGQVFSAQGDQMNARKEEEEALAIRNKIGEKHNAASSLFDLGALALDDKRPSQAQSLAEQAAEEFKNDKSSADEAFAQILLARSLLAQGKLSEAQSAISSARTLSQHSTTRPLQFEMSLASAYIKVAQRTPAVAEAENTLTSSLAEARRCGYLGYEFKLRLALGDIEMKHGNATAGRIRLETLAKDAQAKGFVFVAHSAVALAGAESASH